MSNKERVPGNTPSPDITERKQVEETLRESGGKLRRMFESVTDGIAVTNLNGVITEVNERAVEIHGFGSKNEILGKNAFELIAPYDHERAMVNMQRTLEEGSVKDIEYTLIKADGTDFPGKLSASVINDTSGNPVGFIAITRDITERKRMEHALKERIKELRCLYGIARIAERPGITLDELHQEVVNMLPASWQYPEITCATITLGDKEYKTNNFKTTEWKQSANINLNGQKEGTVEVYYLEARPEIDNGPLIKEERLLINTVAMQLGRITERKRMEEMLRQQNEFLNTILESLTHPFFVIDANDYTIKIANSAAKAGNLSPNLTCYALGHKRDKPCGSTEHPCPLEEVKRSKKPVVVEHIHYDADGNARNVEVHGYPIFDTEGNVTQMIEYCLDITERKRAEEKIRQAAKEWGTTFDSITDLVTICDKDFKLVRMNKAFADTFNKKPEELIGKPCYEVVHGTNEPVANCPQQKTIKTKKPATAEFFEPHLGIHLEVSTSPIFNEEGEVMAVVHIARDITERKRMEQELRSSEERLQILFEFAPDAYYLSDLKGNFVDSNKAAEEITGYKKGELIGKNFLKLKLLPLKQIPKAAALLAKNVLGQPTGPDEFILNRKDGTQVPVEIRTFPAKVKGQTLALGIARDITERKRMERVLQEKNEQLDAQNEELQSQTEELMAQRQELIEKNREVEEANRLKSEFLANMSHELRTPLNVINGFSQLMMDEVPGKINDEQRQCLNDILRASKHLLNLINEVLDLSKIESGKVELELKNIVLTGVIASVTRTMMPILTPRKQSLDVEVEKGLPPVHTDEAKLEQVLLNLVDNSSKFTPDGGKLKIEAVREGQWYQVSVIDNGIGIKKEEQKRIFEPFRQLDDPLTKKKRGTGLGLTLVKQIVERYGGRIWVESEYGKGSRFTFTVPLAKE